MSSQARLRSDDLASDVDGDTLSFVLARGPSLGVVQLDQDGLYRYQPTQDQPAPTASRCWFPTVGAGWCAPQ